jgi:BirA family biotin operon repressor/biotin-[acetyl-CoA-carboxylase] ligase
LSTDLSWPQGYDRTVLSEIDSTNLEAARICSGLFGPKWICALSQTAAKGRRGRAWTNQEGNFAATLVLPNAGPAQSMALRSFVTSLALFDTFVALTGQPAPFALKWPNDVLINGGKVAGILLESLNGGSHLAIGIGVNLQSAPSADQVESGAVVPVSLRGETGADVSPTDFLDVIAAKYAAHESMFTTYGFEPIRTAWLARAAKLGEVIMARTTTSETIGTFETVDTEGHLVLRTAKGVQTIAAADVFF